MKSSALEEMKVHEVMTTKVNPLDLKKFVHNITGDDDGDNEDKEGNYKEDEEEIIYDVVDGCIVDYFLYDAGYSPTAYRQASS